MTRSGPAGHLVPDTLLLANSITFDHSAAHQGFITSKEVGRAVTWLTRQPLIAALQDGRAAAPAAECRHCQPSEPPTVTSANFSGSSIELLYDLVIGESGASDHDIMFEFGGPFRWAMAAVASAGSEPDCIHPEAAPQLYAKPASSPGFVVLYWVRTSRCSHKSSLMALPPDYVRRLMWYHCRVTNPADAEITCSGPAVNVLRSDDATGGDDHVPCLRLPWWPEAEVFLCRHRVTDFPPESARADICRYGVHLVPTGRPGSDTEKFEYRVSFSRAEVVAIRHLSPLQHATITTVKMMKTR